MKWLILMLVIAAGVFNFVHSNQSKSTPSPVKKLNNNRSYSKSSTQTSSPAKATSKSSRGVFVQQRNAISSALKQNSAGKELSKQKTEMRNLTNEANKSLTQARNENNKALRQTSAGSVSQALSQERTSMSRELGF